jgi:hypothetical protein
MMGAPYNVPSAKLLIDGEEGPGAPGSARRVLREAGPEPHGFRGCNYSN